MQKNVKRMILLTVGIIFILFGLIGLVLPILQGIIFLAIGFILVSFCFPKVRLWMKHHTERRPHLSRMVNKMEKWIIKFIGEI